MLRDFLKVEKPELCFPEIEKAFKYFDEFNSIKYNKGISIVCGNEDKY
jgi:hypothetical protein